MQEIECTTMKTQSHEGQREASTSIFETLPTEIISDITSRLSFKSIMKCKLVCKMWLSLISQPLFAKLHHSRITANRTIIDDNMILYDDKCSTTKYRSLRSIQDRQLTNYCACSHKDILTNFDIKNLYPFSDFELFISMVGSCNGLICFFTADNFFNYRDRPFIETPYLYNPVLGQCVALPKPSPQMYHRRGDSYCMCDYQLGFCPDTNVYKLVRIIKIVETSDNYEQLGREQLCEILSIGSAQQEWRSLGKAPKIQSCVLPKMCTTVFVNSSIHWLIRESRGRFSFKARDIVSFNIENEEFGSIPLPFTDKRIFQLGVLDNCLALTSEASLFDETFDVWIMKEYGVQKSWTKKWSLGIQNCWTIYGLKPIKVSSDGQMIFLSGEFRSQTLYSYHPKDKHLIDCGMDPTRIFSYTPTFVSPIEVAEARTKRL